MDTSLEHELTVDDLLAEPIEIVPPYAPPENYMHIDERRDGNRRFYLYVGEAAVLDVVVVDAKENPVLNLARLQSPLEEFKELFDHPSKYADPEVALNIFERPPLSDEEIDQIVGLSNAA